MEVHVEEMFSYTYLPIKLPNGEIVVEKRLRVFNAIIGRVACDFVGTYGLDRFSESHIYITAKHLFQKSGFNREGWHSDGFGTDDISYIWYNKQPTIFNRTDFLLSDDDEKSMQEMIEQADYQRDFFYPNYSLIRMDQYSIHRVGPIESGLRCFLKICFSKDQYNLKGNSINYDLDYEWEYRDRKPTRNVPQYNYEIPK
jgi:hypothetical protein